MMPTTIIITFRSAKLDLVRSDSAYSCVACPTHMDNYNHVFSITFDIQLLGHIYWELTFSIMIFIQNADQKTHICLDGNFWYCTQNLFWHGT